MSVVTNIILTFGCGENELEIIRQVAIFTYQGRPVDLISIDDGKLLRGWYGGNKMFESNVMIGAFNHFSSIDFVKHLNENVNWESSENVILLIKGRGINNCPF